VAAVACALVATLLPWEAVRLVVALPLAVFLPGYAVAAAAFAPYRLDSQRLAMVTLACGLSVICLGGLLLDPLPGGIRTLTWALLLVLVVIGASRAAALRRTRGRPREGRRARSPRGERPRRRNGLRVRPVDAACGALALAAAVAALVIAYTPLPAGDAAGYTALWMLPGHRQVSPTVRVGVISAEQGAEQYRLQVRSGRSQRLRVYRFGLKPGEERRFRVPVELAASGSTRVAASLYTQSRQDRLYRRVTTWLPPGAGAR
jgi:uncharacterized membrane protein